MSLEKIISKTKKSLKSLAYSAIIGLALVGNVPKVNATPLGYTITDIGVGGSYCAINNSGQVIVGSSLWQDGGVMDLGMTVRGINDLGQVVGHKIIGGWPRAFLWEDNQMIDLGTMGGPWSYAYNINNGGQVVGHSKISPADSQYRGFLLSDGQMIDLGNLGTGTTKPYGINDSEQIVGWSLTGGNQNLHAFLWENGQMIDLGTFGGNSSIAWNINNAGQIVGGADTIIGESHAFLWEDGQMRDLGTSPGGYANAFGINELGQIVGSGNIIPGDDPRGLHHAFLWEDNQMIDLNHLLLPNSGWLLKNARDINYKGQIVGFGTNPTGETHAFLLTPIPAMPVKIDIKPGSCPNPVNVKSSGVLPIAILGTDDYDVTTIDPNSIGFSIGDVNVGAIRYSYEDVAAPVSDENECECTVEGPDGYTDLTLKFETQAIVEALGEVTDGEEWILQLTGVLHDDTPIEGEDCIVIRSKSKPGK